jgi:hypothetical protein
MPEKNFSIPPLLARSHDKLWPSLEGCSFPMYAAFLHSEYYEGSDPIGLATRRGSHVDAYETLSTLRCLFVL